MLKAPALVTCIAASTLLGLVGCGGSVASDAPALFTTEEIAARADGAVDTTRGLQAENTLRSRGAQLRARAAQIRRAGLGDTERRRLLERIQTMKSQNP